MDMQTFSESEAKNNLDLVFYSAQRHPVLIDKQGRPFVVILSAETYTTLEDAFWLLQAKQAEEEGFLSEDESNNLKIQVQGQKNVY